MNTLQAPSRACASGFVSFSVLTMFVTAALFLAGCKDDAVVYGPDDLTNPAVQPAIIFTSPTAGSVGPYKNLYNSAEYQAHFILRFNKLMRKASFVPGTIRVLGFERPVVVTLFERYFIRFEKTSGDDYYNDFLEFAIRDSLSYNYMDYRIGQTYTVVIGTEAEDINGNHLTATYSFSFEPEPSFRVIMTSPKDGSVNNDPSSAVNVHFNSRIDQTIRPRLHIAPQITGAWYFTDYSGDVATFLPSTSFPYNSTYNVTVDAGAADIYNNQLAQQFVSSFRFAPFQLSYSYPQDGAENFPTSTGSFYFQFNGAIDTNSIRPSFSITPPVTGTILTGGGGFTFVFSSSLVPSTAYTITISSGLKAMDGTHLVPPATITFTTGAS